MNVLITGSNGFIARNLARNLSKYNLTLTNRSNLNLVDEKEVKNFFKDKYFDVVIHTATNGGSRLRDDDSNVFYQNCLMHQNIMDNSCSFDKYISFGSGAELDRRYNIDAYTDINCSFPIDPYGMSKNFIAKSGANYTNFNNIRLFNVFNSDELSTRMIKASITNYINKQPIVIHQDRYMDFFSIQDLCKVVKFTIDANVKQKNVNCSYKEKYKLSDIANIINNLSNYNVDIVIQNDNLGMSYCGDYNLHLYDIQLDGLHMGIVKAYEDLIESK